MILLNTTFCISSVNQALFLSWAREIYVPYINKYGHSDARILHLPQAESDTQSYAIQFCIDNESAAGDWITESLPEMLRIASDKPYNLSADDLLHFSTAMEVIE